MKILIACEYSGRTRNAFAALGHDVISADFEPAEDNSPYHYQKNSQYYKSYSLPK